MYRNLANQYLDTHFGTGLATQLPTGQLGRDYSTTRHSCSSVPLKAYISSRLEGKRLSAAPTPSKAYSDSCFMVFCISFSISPSGPAQVNSHLRFMQLQQGRAHSSHWIIPRQIEGSLALSCMVSPQLPGWYLSQKLVVNLEFDSCQ